MEDNKDLVTLEFDDGEDIECEVMGVFEANDKEYIALLPLDKEGEVTEDVYIYGYKEVSEDEFELIDIVDDEEFKKAVEVFEELVNGEE